MTNRTAGFRLGAGLVAAGLCALGARGMQAQGFGQPAAPPAPPVHQSSDPTLKNFTWRSIGPANMGGRIDDIAVVDSNPSTFYVAFATGGIWKTVNNGTTFTPVFDDQPVTSIVNTIRALFERQPVGNDIWVALAWCVGILVVAYALAMAAYRRKIA